MPNNTINPTQAGTTPTVDAATKAFNTAADALRGLVDRTFIASGFAPDAKALAQAESLTQPAATPTADQAAWRSSHGLYATNTQIPKQPAQNLFQSHFQMFRPDASGRLGLETTKQGIYEMLLATRPNASPAQRVALQALADVSAATIIGGFSARSPQVVAQPIDPKHPLAIDLNKANALIHSADDSNVYTPDGKVDYRKFDQIFAQFGKGKDYLTEKDFSDMRTAHLDKNAPLTQKAFGEAAAFGEFTLLSLVAGRPQGNQLVIDKQTLRSFYEGTLFPKLMVAAENSANAQAATQTKSSGWIGKAAGGVIQELKDTFKP